MAVFLYPFGERAGEPGCDLGAELCPAVVLGRRLEAGDGGGAVFDGAAEGALPVEAGGADVFLVEADKAGAAGEVVEHLVGVAGAGSSEGGAAAPVSDLAEVLAALW